MTNDVLLTDEQIAYLVAGQEWREPKGPFIEGPTDELFKLAFTKNQFVEAARNIIQANDEARRKAGWLVSPPLPIEDAPRDGSTFLAITAPFNNKEIGYVNKDIATNDIHILNADTGRNILAIKYIHLLPQPTPSDVEGGV